MAKEKLKFINENIKYLDIEYDNLFDLVNYFVIIHTVYSKAIRKIEVEELRRKNREKKGKI